MTDDVLASFIDAYRGEHSARTLDRRAVRARIVAAAGRRRTRRAERLRLLLPFAASFVGSLAFAASPPVRERVREAFSFVRSAETQRATPKPTAKRTPVVPPPLPATASPLPLPAPAPSPEEPAAVSLPLVAAPAPSVRPVAAPSVGSAPLRAGAAVAPPSSASFDVEPTPAPAPQAAVAAPNADLSLYRRAHELHFGGAGEARALSAWDAYLRAFPHGTFAPEARLNRAVCLAKLGRKAEAERVLTDIERGRFGKDGQRQARKILGVLEGE